MSGQPFVRRDVWSLAPEDPIVTAYGRAVALMQERPASDPTSWAYQAAIHGTHAPSPPALANSCRHGSWFFLAWHRMFLYRFEQIVRAAVAEVGGAPDWALPYWNYGRGGESATLPLAFRDAELPDGAPNPLFVAERAPGVNAGGTVPPQIASAARALARPAFVGAPEFGGGIAGAGGQFFGLTGRLEQTPHNDIHNVLGGGSGWMSDPDQAAQDPIFWLHHANIDRIWDEWDPTGARAPADPRWSGQSFPLFDDGGNQVSLSCGAVCDVVADLGYTYDSRPPAPDAAPPAGAPGALEAMPHEPQPEIVGATEQPVELTGGAERVSVAVDARAQGSFLEAAARPAHVYLNIEDIEAERNPGTVYGVYVNLPDDPAPEDLDAHYAGNVSFFGIERARDPRGDEPSHGLRVALEITELIERLTAGGAAGAQQLDVTFRPLSLIAPPGLEAAELAPTPGQDPPVSIGRVSIAYA